MNITYVASDRKEPFTVGDVVWISNSRYADDDIYYATVRAIIDNDQSDGNGLHYVLLVGTHVDDYLVIRKHQYCFESREYYNNCIKKGAKLNYDIG